MIRAKHYFVILAVGFGFSTSAQKLLEDSKEKEIVLTGQGKITLETGSEVIGTITHSMLQFRKVSVKKSDGKEETYKITEVKNFEVNGAFFEKLQVQQLIKDSKFAAVFEPAQQPGQSLRNLLARSHSFWCRCGGWGVANASREIRLLSGRWEAQAILRCDFYAFCKEGKQVG